MKRTGLEIIQTRLSSIIKLLSECGEHRIVGWIDDDHIWSKILMNKAPSKHYLVDNNNLRKNVSTQKIFHPPPLPANSISTSLSHSKSAQCLGPLNSLQKLAIKLPSLLSWPGCRSVNVNVLKTATRQDTKECFLNNECQVWNFISAKKFGQIFFTICSTFIQL